MDQDEVLVLRVRELETQLKLTRKNQWRVTAHLSRIVLAATVLPLAPSFAVVGLAWGEGRSMGVALIVVYLIGAFSVAAVACCATDWDK